MSDDERDLHLLEYRLQHSAYINRRDVPTLGHRDLELDTRLFQLMLSKSQSFSGTSGVKGHTGDVTLENIKGIKSVFTLPSIIISGSDEAVEQHHRHYSHQHGLDLHHSLPSQSLSSPPQTQHPIAPHRPTQHNIAPHLIVPVHHLAPRLAVPEAQLAPNAALPTSKHGRIPRSKTVFTKPAVQSRDIDVTTHAQKSKRRKSNEPANLAMKLSLPCRAGCCYCVYTALLGPVKVYVTRAEPSKKGPFLGKIKDGHGRPVIPVSRKSDLKGLVYDPHSHSLHPPAKGERPLFQEVRQYKKDKSLSRMELKQGPVASKSCTFYGKGSKTFENKQKHKT